MEKNRKSVGLSTKIFIALITGALFGVGIHYLIPAGTIRDTILVEGIFFVIGQEAF